jgi:hypothetical protein
MKQKNVLNNTSESADFQLLTLCAKKFGKTGFLLPPAILPTRRRNAFYLLDKTALCSYYF